MKNMEKRLMALALLLLLLFSVTACGGQENKGEGTTKAEETTQAPQKIISVSPAITELIYKLGASDRLIGRSDYCNYPAEVEIVPSVGSLQTPDMELIISMEPDLVLLSDIVNDELVEKLSNVGIPVVLIKDVSNIDEVYTMIQSVGDMIHCSEEAKACVEEMKATINDVTEKVNGLEAPSVYYVVSYGEYGDATAGGDTFMHDIITTAGGDNIGKDISGWSINLEEIIEKDPDIIILPPYYDGAFQETAHYKDLTAVKEGRVFVIDSDTCDRQGYRNAEAVRILAEIFHPEAFK